MINEICIVDVSMEKLMGMPSKELHQQPSSVVYLAARMINKEKGDFYSDEILKENPYNAFLVLRNLK
ncbi:MAG: hypothetical protein WA139_02595 [Candidatus Aenigmatarchaeota archaeon]